MVLNSSLRFIPFNIWQSYYCKSLQTILSRHFVGRLGLYFLHVSRTPNQLSSHFSLTLPTDSLATLHRMDLTIFVQRISELLLTNDYCYLLCLLFFFFSIHKPPDQKKPYKIWISSLISWWNKTSGGLGMREFTNNMNKNTCVRG